MRIKKLDERVQLLLDLLIHENGAICIEDYGLDNPDITPDHLVKITKLCQSYVKLRSYNVPMAAAWLGLSERGVVEAGRAGRLPFEQLGGPGSEWRLYHEDLVEFAKSRRYGL